MGKLTNVNVTDKRRDLVIFSDEYKSIKGKPLFFSFMFLNRRHELFTMDDDPSMSPFLNCDWMFDLLDGFAEVSKTPLVDLYKQPFELHPVDFRTANTSEPELNHDSVTFEKLDWYQFRINKSKGRIVGVLIDSLFLVVWIDKHHNLTDSPHYPKAKYSLYVPNSYDKLIEALKERDARIAELEEINDLYKKCYG